MTYVSPNQIRATLIMGNTLGGLNPNYNLRLTNPDGQMSNLLTSTFTVFSPSTGTAYAVDYKEVLRSSTFSVVLNGSYFQNWTSTQTSIYLSSSPLLTAVAAPATGYFLYPTNEISTVRGLRLDRDAECHAGPKPDRRSHRGQHLRHQRQHQLLLPAVQPRRLGERRLHRDVLRARAGDSEHL